MIDFMKIGIFVESAYGVDQKKCVVGVCCCFSDTKHKQWLEVWFLIGQMPVLSGKINIDPFSKIWKFFAPKTPMKYRKNGQNFAMSKNTRNVFIATGWRTGEKPHLTSWSRSKFTFGSTPYIWDLKEAIYPRMIMVAGRSFLGTTSRWWVIGKSSRNWMTCSSSSTFLDTGSTFSSLPTGTGAAYSIQSVGFFLFHDIALSLAQNKLNKNRNKFWVVKRSVGQTNNCVKEKTSQPFSFAKKEHKSFSPILMKF